MGARRFVTSFIVSLVIVLALLPLPVAAGQSQYFPQTGQTSQNAFYDFWLTHGALEILGMPISPSYRAKSGFIIQFYERAVMEWHPDNPIESRVQLARLGSADLDVFQDANGNKIGDQWRGGRPRPCTANANCETFPPTNHTVVGAFRDYWYMHGGLATFGYPLTEEETVSAGAPGNPVGYSAQFFERAVFEWHPEVAGGAVLLRRIGVLFWDGADKSALNSATTTVPDYNGVPDSQPYNQTVTQPTYSGGGSNQQSAPPPPSNPPPAPVPSTGVTFTSVQGGPPGGTAYAAVQTAPNASCSINYYTPRGTDSTAQGLYDKTANSSGSVSWSWVIGTATVPGTGTVTVSCNGVAASARIQIG